MRSAQHNALPKQRGASLTGQASVLVNNLDTIIRRLLFSRIPDDPTIELAGRDHRALELIESDGPLTMTDFAGMLGVPVSTATHAVSRLEKKGLADRERSFPDRRIVRVKATDAGHALIKTHVGFRRAMARDMLRPLSPEERNRFLELLAKMSRLSVVNQNPNSE